MNSKQIFKNQDLFSFTFLENEFKNKNDFQISLKENYREEIKQMLKEAPNPPDVNIYSDYTLSLAVGKWFFYNAFIHVMPHQKRVEFLNYQLDGCAEKMTFLHRVESLSQVDYWYSFGEFSYYNPEIEKLVSDWLITKYQGKDYKYTPPLKLIKP